MKPARYALVHVVWLDPTCLSNGVWVGTKDIRDAKTTMVRSVGWLVLDEPDRLAIASCHIVRGGTTRAGVTLIPRGCIKSIEVLAPARG